jgi:hypothetical protein
VNFDSQIVGVVSGNQHRCCLEYEKEHWDSLTYIYYVVSPIMGVRKKY